MGARHAANPDPRQGGDLAPVLLSSPSLPKAIETFLGAGRGRHLHDHTIDSYTNTLNQLKTALGSLSISQIDVPDLDRYRAGREIKATTWRKELETLRAFFAWCLDRKWITENPAKKLKMPRIEELTTPPFTSEKVQKLLFAAGQIASDNTEETRSPEYSRHICRQERRKAVR